MITNLVDAPAQAGKVKEMESLLVQVQWQFCDKLPLHVANPKPADWVPPAQNANLDNTVAPAR